VLDRVLHVHLFGAPDVLSAENTPTLTLLPTLPQTLFSPNKAKERRGSGEHEHSHHRPHAEGGASGAGSAASSAWHAYWAYFPLTLAPCPGAITLGTILRVHQSICSPSPLST
jgi:hypothetical protein